MVSTQNIYQQIVNEMKVDLSMLLKPQGTSKILRKKWIGNEYLVMLFSMLISCVSSCSLRIEKGNHRNFKAFSDSSNCMHSFDTIHSFGEPRSATKSVIKSSSLAL